MKNYKNNIRKIRRDRDITQVELSKKTGISQVAISNYETGNQKPGLDNLIKLSEALKCTIDELVKTTA